MAAPLLNLANSAVEREFLGAGLLSPMQTDSATGDFKRSEGVDNIKNCIIDLIVTRIGERVMNEDRGTRSGGMLFESQQTAIDILPHEIQEAIDLYEPRVTQTQVTAAVDPQNQNTVNVAIIWTVKATGRRDNLIYPYYLQSNGGGISQ